MKSGRCTLLIAGFGVLLATGCKQPDRAALAPASLAELPAIPERERGIPAKVGVEGAAGEPRAIFVPAFAPIELTPEERQVLQQPEPRVPDVLAFYRPARGPAQGVAGESFMALIGVSGSGGGLIGQVGVEPRYGVSGIGGCYAFPQAPQRTGVAVGPARAPGGVAGRGWGLRTGEAGTRAPARAAQRSE